jgi:hypothetical protein
MSATSAELRKQRLESNTPTLVLAGYAVFLALGGFAGFALSGFSPKARSSLIVGCSTAAVIAVCAYLSRVSAGVRMRKIGIHLGLVLPLLLAGVFGWRSWLASASPDKMYLAQLLACMAAVSVVVLATLIKLKPPPPPKQAD